MKTMKIIAMIFALAIVSAEAKATGSGNEPIRAVEGKTVDVQGTGGYNTNTGVVCPDPSSEHCATIVTDFHDNGGSGTWGPVAAIEMWDGTALEGMIDEPIEAPDGEVINFVFSSLHEL